MIKKHILSLAVAAAAALPVAVSGAVPFVPVGSKIDVEALGSHINTGMDISALSLQDLRILRNAVAARQGYCFKDYALRAVFSHTSWYDSLLWERLDGSLYDKPITYTKDEQALRAADKGPRGRAAGTELQGRRGRARQRGQHCERLPARRGVSAALRAAGPRRLRHSAEAEHTALPLLREQRLPRLPKLHHHRPSPAAHAHLLLQHAAGDGTLGADNAHRLHRVAASRGDNQGPGRVCERERAQDGGVVPGVAGRGRPPLRQRQAGRAART